MRSSKMVCQYFIFCQSHDRLPIRIRCFDHDRDGHSVHHGPPKQCSRQMPCHNLWHHLWPWLRNLSQQTFGNTVMATFAQIFIFCSTLMFVCLCFMECCKRGPVPFVWLLGGFAFAGILVGQSYITTFFTPWIIVGAVIVYGISWLFQLDV